MAVTFAVVSSKRTVPIDLFALIHLQPQVLQVDLLWAEAVKYFIKLFVQLLHFEIQGL